MKIKTKFLLVVLPLLVASVAVVGFASYFLASSSVNRLAVDSLTFRSEQLGNYADSQWNILVDNDAVGNTYLEKAAADAVASFANSILNSDTESVFALDTSGNVAMQAGPAAPTEEECRKIAHYYTQGAAEFITLQVAGEPRVAYTEPMRLFGWQTFVTEKRQVFYGQVEAIFKASVIILIAALLLGAPTIIILAGFLTRPMETLVKTMRKVGETNDLKVEVPVLYDDEVGLLSHSFNGMLKTLANAQEQIKKHAFEAVVARKRENKIRNVFQLYVPRDVIEQVFANPENMLVGTNREIAILFSDIRSFTTISEGMAPDDLVNSLNRYFDIMVNVIMDKAGVVDKYIGDAIMAMFGAPVSHGNDALSSVLAGLEMIEALKKFNTIQTDLGAPEFRIGIGINYGEVTVGNIGCDKKMNYTVIGDSVNLASRLEGLTKPYHEPILFSESVADQIKGELPCRVVDRVAVKGKHIGVPILTSRSSLTDAEKEAWKYHAEAVDHYYARRFAESMPLFQKAQALLPGDPASQRFIERCAVYVQNPPPAEWDGVEIMTSK